jgi:phosphoribosyl-ATP pyrophosphohydrolase
MRPPKNGAFPGKVGTGFPSGNATTQKSKRLSPPGGGDGKDRRMAKFTLDDLEARIKERAAASAESSYTRKLLDRGIAHCAKKLGEEAVETALAAVAEDRERLIGEAADLIYHLLVVLAARGVTVAEVEAVLAQRTSQSGLEEKAARKGGD